jgi:hypothetical protein
VFQTVRLSIAVAVLLLMGAAAASARTITATSNNLTAGTAVVGTCGALAGASVVYNARSSTVLTLTVRNLPSTCNGASLSATASNAANADLGHGGPVVVAANAATITLSANPATSGVTTIRVLAVGP